MGARWFVLLAALMAFSWQSIVTHTHVHAHPGTHAAATIRTSDTAQLTDDQSPADQPANCPICQEIGHAGDYLLPTALAFEMPRAPDQRPIVIPTVAPSLRQGLRPWNSRAPPNPLHA
ncbi:MAG: DUF2946 family protein [Sphingobium sp.]|nr:DUF2946 family protein [Sphingobium sp.]